MSFGELLPDDPARIGIYQIVARLGEGGQGIVYLGVSDQGMKAAVKTLQPDRSSDAEAHERFARELAAATRVPSHCTARILDYDLSGSPQYIASEYIEGPTLASAGVQEGDDLYRLAIATATALTSIHGAGVVHRDFKPSNVILGPSGIRVIDFGIARQLSAASTLTSGGAIGTPLYMAPEQVEGRNLTTAADLFAWAGVMVYAATGSAPFQGPTLTALFNTILRDEPDLRDVPDPLRSLVAECLSKDPRKRPAAGSLLMRLLGSAQDVSTALDAGDRIARAQGPVHGYVPTQTVPPRRSPAESQRPSLAEPQRLSPTKPPRRSSAQPPRHSPSKPPAALRRAPVLRTGLAVLALAVASAAGWGVWHLLAGKQDPKVAVPSALAGTWMGVITPTSYTGGGGYELFTLSLTAGLRDGSDSQELAGCNSTDVPQSLTGLTLVLDEHGTTGSCRAAPVKVTLGSPGRLDIAVFSPDNPSAVMYNGQLHRVPRLPHLAEALTGTWTGTSQGGAVTLNLISTQDHSAGTAVVAGATCPVAVLSSATTTAILRSGSGTQNDATLSGTPGCDGTFKLTLAGRRSMRVTFINGPGGDTTTLSATHVG